MIDSWRYSKNYWKAHGVTVFNDIFKKFKFYHQFNGKIQEAKVVCNYWKEPKEYDELYAIVMLNDLWKDTYKDTVLAIMKWVYSTYPPRSFYKSDRSETWNRPSITLDELELPTYKRKKDSIGTDCDDYAILIYSLCRVAGVPEKLLYIPFMWAQPEGWHANVLFKDFISKKGMVPYAVEGSYYPKIAIQEFGKTPYLQLGTRKTGYYYRYIKYIFNEKGAFKNKDFINVNMAQLKAATKEKFYTSRRVWGAALALLATIGVVVLPDQYDLIIAASTVIASTLGITSFVSPKK